VLTPAEERVLAIIDAAPPHVAGAVTAGYVVRGRHGLPAPPSLDAAGWLLRSLERKGALVRVGRRPVSFRRATEES
jgi:hypothetical protein